MPVNHKKVREKAYHYRLIAPLNPLTPQMAYAQNEAEAYFPDVYGRLW